MSLPPWGTIPMFEDNEPDVPSPKDNSISPPLPTLSMHHWPDLTNYDTSNTILQSLDDNKLVLPDLSPHKDTNTPTSSSATSSMQPWSAITNYYNSASELLLEDVPVVGKHNNNNEIIPPIGQHWGEINQDTVVDIPDVSKDIDRAMDPHCLDEYRCDDDELEHEELLLPLVDPMTMYAISLHKYINNMTDMIGMAELANDVNVVAPEDAKDSIPKMPELPKKYTINSLNFVSRSQSDFTLGKDVECPELSDEIVRNILERRVAILLAHIGYETTHQSILDILTDLLEEFYVKICTRTATIIAEEQSGQFDGFPNVIERILTETGMGGVKGINDYYQSRVWKYVNVLRKRCTELDELYATLLIPKREPSPKILKLEPKTEINFDEDPELSELRATLEPGYQLLNSLEAETNLQNSFKSEEDAPTNTTLPDSTAVTLQPEGEMYIMH